jgi:hypothetical protein
MEDVMNVGLEQREDQPDDDSENHVPDQAADEGHHAAVVGHVKTRGRDVTGFDPGVHHEIKILFLLGLNKNRDGSQSHPCFKAYGSAL